MFHSRVFTVIGILALVCALATVAFQLLEMKDFGMLAQLFSK